MKERVKEFLIEWVWDSFFYFLEDHPLLTSVLASLAGALAANYIIYRFLR